MEKATLQNDRSSIKLLKLLLKIAITVLCFWYISTKIDLAKAGEAVKKANIFWLLLAVAALAISKLLASFRLNIYFRIISIHLTQKQNLKLYWQIGRAHV